MIIDLVPRHPRAIDRLDMVKFVSASIAVLAVAVAAVAALVFLPAVGTAVGATAAGIAIYICIGALVTAGLGATVGTSSLIIAKLVARDRILGARPRTDADPAYEAPIVPPDTRIFIRDAAESEEAAREALARITHRRALAAAEEAVRRIELDRVMARAPASRTEVIHDVDLDDVAARESRHREALARIHARAISAAEEARMADWERGEALSRILNGWDAPAVLPAEHDIDPAILAESERLERERLLAMVSIPDFGMNVAPLVSASAASVSAAAPACPPATFLDEVDSTYVKPFKGGSLSSFECIISDDIAKDPCVLLEDSNTYDRPGLKSWLAKNPTRTPYNIEGGPFTIVPNYSLWDENPLCPITGKAFTLPYICRETGYSYDLDAFQNTSEKFQHINCHRSGQNLVNEITLYPNFALWPEGVNAPSKSDRAPVSFVLR